MSTFDPLLLCADLPLRARFYPLGFPVDIASNSPAVLQSAGESWGAFSAGFDAAPITLRFVVSPGGSEPTEPVYRAQAHLTMIVGGRENFAVCDRLARFGGGFVSECTVARRDWFRWYYLEAMTYQLLSQTYVLALHAACVAREGRAILLCGRSGSGKSTLAFACARNGWEYLGDDATMLLLESGDAVAIGKPHHVRLRPDAAQLFPEIALFSSDLRPNGKVGIEIPTASLGGWRIRTQCPIAAVVFVSRTGRCTETISMPGAEAVDRLADDLPAFEPEVAVRHRRALNRLANLPALELRYRNYPDALGYLAMAAERGF